MKGDKNIKKFFLKLLLFASPFLLIVISFIILDPFKVIYHYDTFYYSSASKTYRIVMNRDYISTELYLQNRPTAHYNAFVFGSSKSLAFKCADWKNYLDSSAHPFHYDANNESIFGISKKVKFIDSKKDTIRFALLALDWQVLNNTKDATSHLSVKHPSVSGNSRALFYTAFLKAYISNFFFIKYADYSITKKYKPYMHGILQITAHDFTPVENDMYYTMLEQRLTTDSDAYYRERKNKFYDRSQTRNKQYAPAIKEEQMKMLRDIHDIFDKDHTQYKIIINPAYEEIPFPKRDLDSVQKLFGTENVFDYSGVNRYTENIYNFSDLIHFRHRVGKWILQEIYFPIKNNAIQDSSLIFKTQ